MPHSYASQLPPGVEIDSGIKRFFEEFYKISDTPDVHERYVDSFSEGATLIMASKKGVGRDGILVSLLYLGMRGSGGDEAVVSSTSSESFCSYRSEARQGLALRTSSGH